MTEVRRRLSSSLTVVYKIWFPIIWSGGFGFGTIIMAVSERGPWPMFLAGWIAGTLFLLGYSGSLKHVAIDDKYLYVSGLRWTEAILLTDILAVDRELVINPRRVRVSLKKDTRFGATIRFMPEARFALSGPHPVVVELRRAAGLHGS